LTRERHVHLATQLLYHGARAGPDTDETHAIGCSNGNAAGNTLEEAILQGFLELVERDATAIWWYNRLRRPAVDVAAFGDPWVDALLEHHRAQGRACWALDITSDLGIPAIVAISARADGGDEQMLFGLGCHLDARIAVQRAFAEMNQMLAMADPDGTIAIEALDAETANWLRVATRAAQPHMTPDPAAPPRRPADFPARASGDLRTDILTCQGIVEAKGLELLVLDHTRPDVGLPVVKVVVPGLRHFWARFGAGRLYDVPVAMGWLPAPLSEDALNPIAMFL
jgi:ribosomal protein S12 methylthiotransferase accessory factor